MHYAYIVYQRRFHQEVLLFYSTLSQTARNPYAVLVCGEEEFVGKVGSGSDPGDTIKCRDSVRTRFGVG